MSGRSAAVLERFPCHLALSDPGKRFGRVVEGLTDELDVVTRQIGDVRRAHRLAEAPTMLDLERLGGLHAIVLTAYALVCRRHDALAVADPDDTTNLSVLTNMVLEELDALDPVDRREATERMASWTTRREAARCVVRSVVTSHRRGNGTATGLLLAAAGYLGFELDPDDVVHSSARWWHFAPATDGMVDDFELAVPQPDLFALEENPYRNASTSPAPRRHADRFSVRRGGLDDVTTSVVVVGQGERTVAPMVVNVDLGTGVVYDGTVPDGAELVFEVSGRVLLDDADVTGMAFMFSGGVFADESASHPSDMVFAETPAGDPDPDTDEADRRATFVVTTPVANGFAPAPSLPHGGTVGGLPLPRGESRWAFFVRIAHYGAAPRPAVARNSAGLFDRSVFAAVSGPPGDTSGSIGFRWEEREPFAVRILLPQRLAALDDDNGTVVREPLRALLDRHRAAGVHLTVAYADPRWRVGEGIVRPTDTSEALGTVISGTTLWPDDTPQPIPI